MNLTAFAFETLKATAQPQQLTGALYGSAEKAFITFEGGLCRYRYDDAGKVTKHEGHLAGDGDFLVLSGLQQIQNFNFIGVAEEHSAISVSYERH